MKKIAFTKDILPHIVAVAAFLLITLFFFSPVFFDNKTIDQYDIQMWEGSSKALRDFRDKTGEEGLWAPSMFSGMPAYLVNVEWSNGPVLFFKKVVTLGLPHPIANIFAAFVAYYIMLLAFRVRPYLAIAGAVAFGLSSYMIIGLAAGHNARIGAIAFLPLIMAGIHLAISGKRLLGFGVTTLGMALHLRENHMQITYYFMFIVVVYGIVRLVEFIREGKALEFWKSIAMLVPAVLIAAGTFFGPFWALTEYSHFSIRGPSDLSGGNITAVGLDKAYTFQGKSNGIWEPMTLMIPNFYGGSSMQSFVSDQQSNVYKALMQSGNQETVNQLANYTTGYWGPQSLAAPYYAGAVICFLFVLGILWADKKYVWWLVPVSVLSIVLTWGDSFSAFNYFMLDYFPGYNKFRSVTFALVIILFAMPLLGMIGLENLLKEGWTKNTLKKLAWPLGLTMGICFILAVSGGFGSYLRSFESDFPVWFTNALRADRIALFRADAWRSFWFILVFGVALYARLKNWIKDPVFFLITVLLVTIDIALVDKRYFNNYQRKRAQTAFTPYASDQVVMQDKSYYRVYNLQGAFTEARSSYFHNSIGGYHGAKLRRYQDLYDSCIFRETQQLINSVQSGELNFKQFGVLNMLNVKYVVYGPDQKNLFPNPFANGSAWFVDEVMKVNSANEELRQTGTVDTRTTAVVDGSAFNMTLPADSTGTVELKDHQPNYLKYESKSQADGLVVFSEIYYPKGWKAFVDGKETPIIRADYVLRALTVPAGNHTIEFKFEPSPYFVGNKITSASSWLLLLIVLGSLGWTLKKD